MSLKHQDTLLVGAAFVLTLASLLWFGPEDWKPPGARRNVATMAVALSALPYVAANCDVPTAKTGVWGPPGAQHGGKGWIYDVFTPPKIFYSERLKQFRVSPPRDDSQASAASELPIPPFGLELLAVKHTPFRLQLVGFVGDERECRGVFENMLTAEIFLAGSGYEYPALNLVIENIGVRRTPVPLPDSMTTNRLVAIAAIRDQKSSETVTLTSGERHYPTAALATVKTAESGSPRDVHEGDEVEVQGAVYRIQRIQITPPALDVTKVGPDALMERRTLTAPEISSAPDT